MWFFWLLVAVAVVFYLGQKPKKKGGRTKGSRAARKRARPVFSVSDLAEFLPITTQATASKALEHLLVSAGYAQHDKGVLRETLSDFKQAMRGHAEAVQSDIDEHKKELEYEQDQLEEPDEEEGGEVDAADRAEYAQQLKQVRVRQADLAQDAALLKQYKLDRADFVAAYANHVLHDKPHPSREWQQATF